MLPVFHEFFYYIISLIYFLLFCSIQLVKIVQDKGILDYLETGLGLHDLRRSHEEHMPNAQKSTTLLYFARNSRLG